MSCEARWRVVEKGASEKADNEKVSDGKWIPLVIFMLSAQAVGLSARLIM